MTEMKPITMILLLGCSLAATATAGAQATRQTVEGAQAFLQGLNEGGGSGAYPAYVVGGFARFDGDPALLKYWQKSIDAIDETGRTNPCVTRITDIGGTLGVRAQGQRWNMGDRTELRLPPGGFPVPRYIHWGKASVQRQVSSGGTGESYLVYAAVTSAFGTSGGWEAVGFEPKDVALADRIEYAMRFLQASCDASAGTGF